MMRFKITNNEIDDSFIIGGATIKECQNTMKSEIKKRNWNINYCWSRQL